MAYYLQGWKAIGRLLRKLPQFKHILQRLFGHVIFCLARSYNVLIGVGVTNSTRLYRCKEKSLKSLLNNLSDQDTSSKHKIKRGGESTTLKSCKRRQKTFSGVHFVEYSKIVCGKEL